VNRLDELYRDRSEPAAYARGYLEYLSEIFAQLDEDAIAAFIRELLEARDRRARIYFLGNGGSAATAGHFVNDISIGSQSWERPFRAVSLADNVAVLTAIANDSGYEHVFTDQLRSQMHEGDLVVAISVSGNSPNVLAAVEYAKAHGARTVGLTGFDGGRLREIAHVAVHVPTNRGEYAPAEDVHLVLDHLVGSFIVRLCAAGG
jgi:D-sedoheptulose 7-phosphate isomerase